jgi:hypothetical protein
MYQEEVAKNKERRNVLSGLITRQQLCQRQENTHKHLLFCTLFFWSSYCHKLQIGKENYKIIHGSGIL